MNATTGVSPSPVAPSHGAGRAAAALAVGARPNWTCWLPALSRGQLAAAAVFAALFVAGSWGPLGAARVWQSLSEGRRAAAMPASEALAAWPQIIAYGIERMLGLDGLLIARGLAAATCFVSALVLLTALSPGMGFARGWAVAVPLAGMATLCMAWWMGSAAEDLAAWAPLTLAMAALAATVAFVAQLTKRAAEEPPEFVTPFDEEQAARRARAERRLGWGRALLAAVALGAALALSPSSRALLSGESRYDAATSPACPLALADALERLDWPGPLAAPPSWCAYLQWRSGGELEIIGVKQLVEAPATLEATPRRLDSPGSVPLARRPPARAQRMAAPRLGPPRVEKLWSPAETSEKPSGDANVADAPDAQSLARIRYVALDVRAASPLSHEILAGPKSEIVYFDERAALVKVKGE